MMANGPVAIIGLGTMGTAILRGILGEKRIAKSKVRGTVRTASRARGLSKELGIPISTDNAGAVADAGTVVICLKPQNVLGELRKLEAAGALSQKPLIVSIAAGVTTREIESALDVPCPVVRVMPNTPCAISKGTIALTAGSRATTKHLKMAHTLFAPLGVSFEIEEKHFDIVTGLSGSGPAFGYLMIEALADGAVMMGLPRTTAIELAARTLLGSAEMVLATDKHPASLKDEVTTPGGCTIAGILALEDGKIRSTLARAVERATQKAAGLGPESDEAPR